MVTQRRHYRVDAEFGSHGDAEKQNAHQLSNRNINGNFNNFVDSPNTCPSKFSLAHFPYSPGCNHCTVEQNRAVLRHLIIDFPTSSGVKQWTNDLMDEWVAQYLRLNSWLFRPIVHWTTRTVLCYSTQKNNMFYIVWQWCIIQLFFQFLLVLVGEIL